MESAHFSSGQRGGPTTSLHSPFKDHFIACAAFHPFSEGFAVVHKSTTQCLIGPVSASII